MKVLEELQQAQKLQKHQLRGKVTESTVTGSGGDSGTRPVRFYEQQISMEQQ